MLQTIRRSLLFLALPIGLFAQGYSVENYSQEASNAIPTVAGEFNSFYGQAGTGSDSAFGCTITVSTCAVKLNNSSGALTIQSQAASVCGPVPTNSGGPSAKMLDYSTTLGASNSNQDILYNLPAAQSSVIQGVVWFCSDIPVTANFGTTFDAVILIGTSSRISNYTSNGTSQHFTIESCSGGSGAVCTPVSYTPGTWVQVSFQFVNGGACNDSVAFTDCIRVALSDKNGAFIGQVSSDAGGAGPAFYVTLGNLNAISSGGMPSGHHVQYMNLKMCYEGCTASQFPLLENPVPPWDGVINNPARGFDWRNAGIQGNNNGTLPSASWTQLGTTLAAGSYTGAAISSSMSGCSNQFYQLGAGTFNISGTIAVPVNCELRGSGANSTFIVASSAATCRTVSAVVCVKNTGDNTFIGNTPSVLCNWTAGYAQGSNKVTLSGCTGAGITSIVPGTLLALTQCGTGFSGSGNCTGTATDNGNFFECLDKWNGTTGCSTSGGGSFERPSTEIPVVTAINTGTGVATIFPPLILPIWASGRTPTAQVIQPISNSGVQNLSIDLSAAGAATSGVELFDAYHTWIGGVRVVNNKFTCLEMSQVSLSIVQSNYCYGTTATLPSGYGVRLLYTEGLLAANNIVQNISSPFFSDQPTVGNVWAYNFSPGDQNSGGFMSESFTEHWSNYYTLFEGNIANQINLDDVHGNANMNTKFRNFMTGWTSFPSSGKNSNTTASSDIAFTRYQNIVGNVFGTPGYTSTYNNNGGTATVYWLGAGNGAASPPLPADPLGASTTVRFANYDTVTGANRFCGNSLDTGWSGNCSSTSEAARSASTFPGFVPVVGDAAIGQPALPASFIFTSRPSWWVAGIPFPAIGPDVTSGNVGQCSGTINTIGQMAKVPALTGAQCIGTSLTASQWGGQVNANPAMACALNVMSIPPDGSGSVRPFDAGLCFGAAAPIATFTPSSVNFGQVPAGLTSNPIPVTLQNTGTANLVVSTVSLGSAVFSLINNTCGSPATITNTIPGTGFTLTPGTSCTFQAIYQPAVPNFTNTASVFFSPGASNPDTFNLSGLSTGPSAPTVTIFAGSMTYSGTARVK